MIYCIIYLGKTPTNCRRGPQPVLIQVSKEAGLKVDLEKTIYEHLKNQARRGFPLKRDNLLELVPNLLNAEKMTNPFASGVPGKSWFYAFKARHPDLSLRTAEHHSLARAALNEGAVRGWFKMVLDFCKEEELLTVLEDPNRVLNCDETPFKVCQTSGLLNCTKSYFIPTVKMYVKSYSGEIYLGKFIGVKGESLQYVDSNGCDKESYTVMVTAAGNGELLAPVLILKYQRIPVKVIIITNLALYLKNKAFRVFTKLILCMFVIYTGHGI
jgi:hypothetical protein